MNLKTNMHLNMHLDTKYINTSILDLFISNYKVT